MLKVICNTTPIITLLSISKLDLLHQLYRRIIIPRGVFEEIEQGKDKKFYQDLSIVDWIEIKSISLPNLFTGVLDKGEAEVIMLAKELKADLVIIDEKLARRHAQKEGLKVTGTLGILVKAKRLGLINEVKPLLNDMLDSGIWLNPKLIEEVLALAGEK